MYFFGKRLPHSKLFLIKFCHISNEGFPWEDDDIEGQNDIEWKTLRLGKPLRILLKLILPPSILARSALPTFSLGSSNILESAFSGLLPRRFDVDGDEDIVKKVL